MSLQHLNFVQSNQYEKNMLFLLSSSCNEHLSALKGINYYRNMKKNQYNF